MKKQALARGFGLPISVGLVYFFLYIPIIVVIVFSFNDAHYAYVWRGFTTRWYYELWHSAEVWDALTNSLIVACSAVVLSLTMGVLVVWHGSHTALARLFPLFYGTLAAPEIVLAVGLLTLFSALDVELGFTSLIAAHTLLGLGYVVPMVHARFSNLDKTLTEASLDLGATRGQTFFKVILPLLFPSLFAAGLLVFIISLDDFLISFFCSGATAQTLPMYIFSMIRAGSTPVVNALSTVMLVVSSIFVLGFSWIQVRRMGMRGVRL